MTVPKDSYLLVTIFAVVFIFYYLCTRTSYEMPPFDPEMMHMHQPEGTPDVKRGFDSPLDGLQMLRDPKSAPRVDHNLKGPVYNFNIPGLSEGWITLSDSTRVYKIDAKPLSW